MDEFSCALVCGNEDMYEVYGHCIAREGPASDNSGVKSALKVVFCEFLDVLFMATRDLTCVIPT